MTLKSAVAALAFLIWTGVSSSQPSATNTAVIVSPADAKWTNDAPGIESVVLREDPKTGSLELFARYPAGHVFKPHWHDANERMILIEGRLSLGKEKFLEPGGFAYLPAKEVQTLACVSETRCSFYVYWDGNSASHRP
jgi:glyoxylate utilization-related uncharacterized protein